MKEQLLKFLANAKTRNGSVFTLTTFQKDTNDNINAIKGTVTDSISGEETTAYWNINGYCMTMPNSMQYDLVTEEPIVINSKNNDNEQ